MVKKKKKLNYIPFTKNHRYLKLTIQKIYNLLLKLINKKIFNNKC
jgi:hypothetical protein